MTTYERIKEEGRAEGLAEARVEGRLKFIEECVLRGHKINVSNQMLGLLFDVSVADIQAIIEKNFKL